MITIDAIAIAIITLTFLTFMIMTGAMQHLMLSGSRTAFRMMSMAFIFIIMCAVSLFVLGSHRAECKTSPENVVVGNIVAEKTIELCRYRTYINGEFSEWKIQ